MKWTLLFLCLFFLGSMISQEVDTTLLRLERVLERASSDSLRIDAKIALGEYEIDHNFTRAEHLLSEVLVELQQKKTTNKTMLGVALVQNGVVERRKGNHTKTLELYLQALEIFKNNNDSLRSSDVYHNLGMLYRHRKDNEKAIEFYEKSIAIKEIIKDTHGLGASYNMMGVSLRRLHKIDSAVVCYDKAKELFKSIDSFDDVQRVNNNMGVVYSALGQYEKALEFQGENVVQAKRLNKQYSLANAYYNISNVYKNTKNYPRAMLFADSSLAVAERVGLQEQISLAYRRKSFLYKKLGNYEQAYENYRIYNRHSDSIYNIENEKKLQELELSYKFRQEQLADSLQFALDKKEVSVLAKSEAKQKNMYLILFLVTLISGGLIFFLLRKNQRNNTRLAEETLEKEKMQKELLGQKLRTNEDETKRLIADNSMRLAFKQELLDRIKMEVAAKHPEKIQDSLKSLTMDLQSQITTERKLSGIQHKIDEVNKGFDVKLRELYPELTKTEREMCSLLRLNFSIKEIMTIRNASIDSVKSTRYRIRKKMALEPGQELENHIQSIS